MHRHAPLWAVAILVAAPLAASAPTCCSIHAWTPVPRAGRGTTRRGPPPTSTAIRTRARSERLLEPHAIRCRANFECLPAAPGPYIESGYVWVDGAPGDTAYLWFFFYPDASCAAVSSTEAISSTTSAAQWKRLKWRARRRPGRTRWRLCGLQARHYADRIGDRVRGRPLFRHRHLRRHGDVAVPEQGPLPGDGALGDGSQQGDGASVPLPTTAAASGSSTPRASSWT